MGRKPNVAYDVFKYINMHDNDRSVCWEWTGALGGRENDRRPYFTLNGRRVLAYRVVFDLCSTDGPLQDNELVRHTCDNPLCCNPSHLLRGDHSSNTQDKLDRERHGGLPMAVVTRIKALWATNEYTQTELAQMFKIARSTVSSIVTGHRRTGAVKQEESDLTTEE